MKQIIYGVLLAFGSTSPLLACDICGCASSAFTTGMLPNSKYHFVGLRSTFRWFESFPSPDGHGYNGVSKQLFTTTDLIGRYKITKRLQLQAYIPFVYNQKVDSVTTSIQGLGDIVALGNYAFADNMDSTNREIRHSGTVGLGVKVPTGMFFRLGFNEVNMLPGTGSTDFIANVNYAVQYKNVGTQNETGFTYKTENKYKYRFGNALSLSQMLYYQWKVNDNLVIVPQIGINYMHNWKDRKNGKYSDDTFNGGNIYNALVNIYVLYKKLSFNTQLYIPLAQKLNQNLVTQKSMLRVGVSYFFKTRK